MVAAPFKASMVVAKGSPNGPRKLFALTGSDVAAEYLLFPSGSSDVVLSGDSDVYIVDMVYSAAGTDTTNDQIFIGGTSDGTVLYRSTSLTTTVSRILQNAPVKVPKGQSIKFKQLA
jgi:hypothetical protein